MSYERDYGRCCEAPDHVDGCHGKGTTKDHFTPECIAKELGWSFAQTNDEANLQYLSPACHRAKDKDTPLRRDLLREQKNGANVPFPVHQQIFEMQSMDPLLVFRRYGEVMEPGKEYILRPPKTKRPRRR